MSVSTELIAAFAPTGKLTAAINVGNPILANQDATGQPFGDSIDLAHGLGKALSVEVKLIVFDAASKSVEAVTQDQADFGFFAVDPVRGAGIAFKAPYVLIEGAYLVKDAYPISDNAEVDRAGHRIVVGQGSAYDLYLTREIKQATLVRSSTLPTVVDAFIALGAEVAAGVKQQLGSDMRRLPGLRLLPGRLMVIQEAMGLPNGRGDAAPHFLHRYVEEQKASGFKAKALVRHGFEGALVAPAQV